MPFSESGTSTASFRTVQAPYGPAGDHLMAIMSDPDAHLCMKTNNLMLIYHGLIQAFASLATELETSATRRAS